MVLGADLMDISIMDGVDRSLLFIARVKDFFLLVLVLLKRIGIIYEWRPENQGDEFNEHFVREIKYCDVEVTRNYIPVRHPRGLSSVHTGTMTIEGICKMERYSVHNVM